MKKKTVLERGGSRKGEEKVLEREKRERENRERKRKRNPSFATHHFDARRFGLLVELLVVAQRRYPRELARDVAVVRAGVLFLRDGVGLSEKRWIMSPSSSVCPLCKNNPKEEKKGEKNSKLTTAALTIGVP